MTMSKKHRKKKKHVSQVQRKHTDHGKQAGDQSRLQDVKSAPDSKDSRISNDSFPPKSSKQSSTKRNIFRWIQSGPIKTWHAVAAGAVILVLVLIVLNPFGIGRTSTGGSINDDLITGGGRFPPMKPLPPPEEEVAFQEFVGSDSCMLCHIEQYSLWRNSTHGRAGGDPDDVWMFARFDNQPRKFNDAVFIPQKMDDGRFVFIVREYGRPEQVVSVDAVVGGGHMEGGGTQSFFTEYPDGTLRFIPFDYNRTDAVWFVQLADFRWVPISEEVSIRNLYNWPPHRILGTYDQFATNCQNCHGSQILVTFNPDKKKYETRYTTLQINCESCHGPGRKHIDLMRTADLDTLTDIQITVLSTVNKDESLNKCFECHAVKAALTNDFLPGMDMFDHYSLKLPILASIPYLPDGRIREFAYQQNHIFSDCYISGSMTCIDCHDPHSQRYRDITFQTLVGKFDDEQCLDCHPSKREDREHHSYHQTDSPGNVCTACHMPFLQHRMLGPHVRFARSDHVIPIPRPEFDSSLGIENACQQCHLDKSIAWQQQKTDEWYRTIKPHNAQLRANMQAQSVRDIHEAADLLLADADVYFPAAQVTGLFDLIKRFLIPDMPALDKSIVEQLKEHCHSPDPDVKALALAALHLSSDHKEDIHTFLVSELDSLGEYATPVRYRWGFALEYVGTLFTLKKDYSKAIRTLQKSLEIKPADPFTIANLAHVHTVSGNRKKALELIQTAIDIEPTKAPFYFQLSNLYSSMHREKDAADALRNGLRFDPENLAARQALHRLEQRGF